MRGAQVRARGGAPAERPAVFPAPAKTPVITIRPSRGWAVLRLGDLWEYRELLYFLVWRDIKVRYKQTAIGAVWAVLQPITTMVIFTIIFSKFAKIPSDGIPYPVFAYAALLPWNLFATGLNRAITSLVANTYLISKVYFPRLIIPMAGTVVGAVDFAIAFLILVGMMAWFGITPPLGVLGLPVFVLLALLTAFAVGLWLSALNVKYRDVGHAVPFLLQFWMYASPVVYPASLIPERWRPLYYLNPMTGVIEGFRWALFGRPTPHFGLMAVSAAGVLFLLAGGIIYFSRTERTFADII